MQELLRPPSLDEEKSSLLLLMGLLNLVQVAENHYCPAADLCKTAVFFLFFFFQFGRQGLYGHMYITLLCLLMISAEQSLIVQLEKLTHYFVCRAAPPSKPGYRQCSVGKLRLLPVLSLFCTSSVLPILPFFFIYITPKKNGTVGYCMTSGTNKMKIHKNSL